MNKSPKVNKKIQQKHGTPASLVNQLSAFMRRYKWTDKNKKITKYLIDKYYHS